jgi:hypothetical protein
MHDDGGGQAQLSPLFNVNKQCSVAVVLMAQVQA